MEKEINTDISTMSSDELKDFINTENGTPINSTNETSSDTNTVVDETENVNVNENDASTDTSEDVKLEESSQPEEKHFYKGKSREQIIEMQENATKKISQQENYLHKLNKEIEELKNSHNELINNQKTVKDTDDFDEILENYNQDDVNVINKLVEKKLNSIKQNEKKQTETELKQNFLENDAQFKAFEIVLHQTNPELIHKFQEKLQSEFNSKGRSETIDKKGWFMKWSQKTLSDIKNNNDSEKAVKSQKNLVARKLKANPVPTSSTSNNGSSLKGVPAPRGAEEYRQWVKVNHGITI